MKIYSHQRLSITEHIEGFKQRTWKDGRMDSTIKDPYFCTYRFLLECLFVHVIRRGHSFVLLKHVEPNRLMFLFDMFVCD